MYYSSKGSNIWRNNYDTPSCNSFIGNISKIFCSEHLLPKIKSVQLVGGESFSLPYYYSKDMFLSLDTYEKLNQPENMISEDLDN